MTDDLETKTFSVEVDYQPQSEKIITERWRNQSGEFDRLSDLPAYVEYCPHSSKAIYQRWHSGGDQHREGDKPAVIVTNPDTGVRIVESFELLGRSHREGDKPAIIRRTKHGITEEESYWRYGKLHRDPEIGPAKIVYDHRNGKIQNVEFWFNGERITPPSNEPSIDI